MGRHVRRICRSIDHQRPSQVLDTGGAWRFTRLQQIDFHAGLGLNSSSVDHYFGIGYSVRFDGLEEWRTFTMRMRAVQRLVKTGGRLIKHARYYWLLLAESHLTRRLFGGMLRRIVTLPSPAG